MLNKKISIIIVNYRSVDFLKNCVNSIYKKLQGELFEVIVVNNDKDLLDIEAINIPGIKIINNKENVGFGAGINIGAEIAQGDILFFLNPDTEVINIDIKEIFSLFDSNKNLGAVGGQLRSANDKAEKWSAGYGLNLVNLIRNNLGWSNSNKFLFTQKPIKVGWVSAAALFIRKDIFNELGGFDEKFFMYFEDMDLCSRIKKIKKDILYFPKAIVKHYGGESYQNKKTQKKDYYYSQKLYFKKHRNIFEFVIVKIASKLFYNV